MEFKRIGYVCFDRYDTEDDSEFIKLRKIIDTVNDLIGSGTVADFFPYLIHLPLPSAAKTKNFATLLQAFFKEKWDEHNEAFDPSISNIHFKSISVGVKN